MANRRAQKQLALVAALTVLTPLPCAWSLEILSGPALTMDPTGMAPLTAVVNLTTDVPTRATLTVSGATGTWSVAFPGFQTNHALPVLGLKVKSSYTVDVVLTDQSAQSLSADAAMPASTGPLPADFPVVEVLYSEPAAMEPGLTLLDRFSRSNGEKETRYTMILDAAGDIVWYSPLGANATLQLQDGTLRYRDRNDVVVIDLLGTELSRLTLQDPGLGLHHELIETADGTYLSLSRELREVDDYPSSDTDPDAPTRTATIQDNPVVEFLADGTLLNSWRLTDLIDPTRIAYSGPLASTSVGGLDWAHANAVFHDETDNSILVSIRSQDAVIKFSRATGELIWIMGRHDNWKPEFLPYLLQPVGQPFEWQYHQHAISRTPSGTYLLFDNGNNRAMPFDGTVPLEGIDNFSRGVEYAIDEVAKTITQVWEWGENLDARLFCAGGSGTDWLPQTGNRLVNFGFNRYVGGVASNVLGLGRVHARITEVTQDTPPRSVFDVQVYNPVNDLEIRVYRAERIPGLYGANISIESDADSDGVFDAQDNCTEVANADQLDSNGDGIGNRCDADLDGDCVVNFTDLARMKQVFFQSDADADLDGSGVVNFSDLAIMQQQFFGLPGPSAAGCH